LIKEKQTNLLRKDRGLHVLSEGKSRKDRALHIHGPTMKKSPLGSEKAVTVRKEHCWTRGGDFSWGIRKGSEQKKKNHYKNAGSDPLIRSVGRGTK